MHKILLLCLFTLAAFALQAQNAPVTTAGRVLDAVPGPVAVPITVDDYVGIGSGTLTLHYDNTVMSYTGAVTYPVLTGIQVTEQTPGTIEIGWFTLPGVSLPGGTTIVTLNFLYVDGTSELVWDNDINGGAACQYSDDSFNVLNDLPTETYYKNGVVTNRTAPEVIAPVILNAVNGPVSVPVTVVSFFDIGDFEIALDFGSACLTYTGATPNAAFGAGVFTVTPSAAGGGMTRLTMSYNGPAPVTLADGSTLVTLNFSYLAQPFTSNSSQLKWYDCTGCGFEDGDGDALYDSPFGDYFTDGLVASQLAPLTWLPVITNAALGTVTVPVLVTGFEDIGSVALRFNYDPAVLTYVNNAANPAFAGQLICSNQIVGGLGRITIGGFFAAPITLADNSYLLNINFSYSGGSTPLTFITDGTSCEYGDPIFNALYDLPYADYYHNGLITSGDAPLTVAGDVTGIPGEPVTVPVLVYGFQNINSVSLSMIYDPQVLTYVCSTPCPEIALEFDAGQVNTGLFNAGWFSGNPATALTLPDGYTLMYVTFMYNGGASDIVFYDNGGTCQYTAGVTYTPLYDQPKEDYYQDGSVGEMPLPAPAVWTGLVSDDWNEPGNWNLNMVPDSFFDVFVDSDPEPPQYPFFDGDLRLGEHCRNLTLTGPALLEVTGDLDIGPGRVLNMVNNAGGFGGLLKVGGDWNNYGAFAPGSGTVEFYGEETGDIPAESAPTGTVLYYEWSTFAGGMTPLSGATPGPTGDNAHLDVALGFSFFFAGAYYSEARLSTNGWLSLDKSGDDFTGANNLLLFFEGAPNCVLSPWWDNLLADGSTTISYKSEGGVFTAEWKNILAWASESSTRLNFQAKLYEATGAIEFHYGTLSAGAPSPNEGASIGIKDATGGAGHYREGSTGSGKLIQTCLESLTDWPVQNIRFTLPEVATPEVFHRVVVTKEPGAVLDIQRDVHVTGLGGGD